jgi:hypothetical protein
MPRTLVTEETICCGYKRCPVVREYDDGSIVIEDEGRAIEFNPDQAARLRAKLGAQGKDR